jgi:hypothetical protein
MSGYMLVGMEVKHLVATRYEGTCGCLIPNSPPWLVMG